MDYQLCRSKLPAGYGGGGDVYVYVHVYMCTYVCA